jgi:hypothetical protein
MAQLVACTSGRERVRWRMQHGKRGKSALWAALGLAGLCACGEETGQGEVPAEGSGVAEECAGAEAPEPVSVDAEVSVVATDQAPFDRVDGELSQQFFTDGSGIYWNDFETVFAQRQGEAGFVELLSLSGIERADGEPGTLTVLNMAAGADQLYVSDVYLENLVGFPPSRILSVPKQGGPATVVLESEDSTLWPIAVDGARLIVMVQGEGGASYQQVNLEDPQLEPLPLQAPSSFPRVIGNTMYWLEEGVVLRSGFDDAQPQQFTRLTDLDFSVGPDYLMTRGASRAGRSVVKTLDVQDGSSNCTVVPRSAPLNSSAVALAPRHIYYVTLRNRVPADDLTAYGEIVQLELDTGALTRLNMPGIILDVAVALVAQDAESLYVLNGNTLLAVRKP